MPAVVLIVSVKNMDLAQVPLRQSMKQHKIRVKKGRNSLPWCLLSLLVFLIDRVSKYYVSHFFLFGEPHTLIPYLNIMLVFNKGTAFSLLNQGKAWEFWFLTLIALVVSAMVLVWLFCLPRQAYWRACALSLILGGALGNIWDRISLGYVIDFIDVHFKSYHFATFNIADAAITIGAMLLVLEAFSQKNDALC